MKAMNWRMSVSADSRKVAVNNVARRRERYLEPSKGAAVAVLRRFAWRSVACLVIGMCVYALNFEPAGPGRLVEFNPIRTAAAGEPGATPSLRAPEKGGVTVDQHAGPWRVVAATGSSRYRHGDLDPVGWQAVVVGLAIEPYAEIETASDGRLELFNGRDRMALAPNSMVAFPDAGDRVPDIIVLQSLGQVHYDVESRRTGLMSRVGRMFLTGSRPEGRFEVHTPLLVAAVKGTTFTVQVDTGAAVVDVAEGAVLVTSSRSGRSAYVKAGRRATVGADTADAVSVDGDDTGGATDQPGDEQDRGSDDRNSDDRNSPNTGPQDPGAPGGNGTGILR